MTAITEPAQQLRTLADFLASAQRYGLPAPSVITVRNDGAVLHIDDRAVLDDWSEYVEAPVTVDDPHPFDGMTSTHTHIRHVEDGLRLDFVHVEFTPAAVS